MGYGYPLPSSCPTAPSPFGSDALRKTTNCPLRYRTPFTDLNNTAIDTGKVVLIVLHLFSKLIDRFTEFQRLLRCSCAMPEIAGPIACLPAESTVPTRDFDVGMPLSVSPIEASMVGNGCFPAMCILAMTDESARLAERMPRGHLSRYSG